MRTSFFGSFSSSKNAFTAFESASRSRTSPSTTIPAASGRRASSTSSCPPSVSTTTAAAIWEAPILRPTTRRPLPPCHRVGLRFGAFASSLLLPGEAALRRSRCRQRLDRHHRRESASSASAASAPTGTEIDSSASAFSTSSARSEPPRGILVSVRRAVRSQNARVSARRIGLRDRLRIALRPRARRRRILRGLAPPSTVTYGLVLDGVSSSAGSSATTSSAAGSRLRDGGSRFPCDGGRRSLAGVDIGSAVSAPVVVLGDSAARDDRGSVGALAAEAELALVERDHLRGLVARFVHRARRPPRRRR